MASRRDIKRTLFKRNEVRQRFGEMGGGGTGYLHTLTGALLHFTDGLARPAESLTVTFATSETGYTGANVCRRGENLYSEDTAEWQNGYYITEEGEISSYGRYKTCLNYIPVESNTEYIFSYRKSTVVQAGCFIGEYDEDKNFIKRTQAITTSSTNGYKQGTVTLSATTKFIRFCSPYSSSAEGKGTVNIQINLASTAFSATVTFPNTIYGGSFDFVSGEGIDENGNPFSAEPTEIDILEGENNIWTDSESEITLEYWGSEADDPQLLANLNVLLGGRYYNNHTPNEPTDAEALDILLGKQ